MKRKEHLLVCIMEECAEIQQAVAKGLRFGLDDTHPDYPEITNEVDIMTEFYQLVTVIELLEAEGIVSSRKTEEIEKIKKGKLKKLEFYMEYSKNERKLIED